MHLKPIYTIQHVDFLRNIVENYKLDMEGKLNNNLEICGKKCTECFLNCREIIGITDKELYELALDGLARAGKL